VYVYGTLAVRSGYGVQWGTNGYNLIYGDQTANELYLYTNNVQRLLIASTGAATFSSSVTATQGNFINAASNFPLTIDNSTQGYVAQVFKSNNVTFGYIGNANTLNSGGSNTDMVIRSENALILSSSSAERMRIWQTTGNVNIGTTPASDSGYKLDVNGTGRFGNQLTAYGFYSTNSYKADGGYYEAVPNYATYSAWNLRVGAQAADACYYITGGGKNILTTEGYSNPYTVKLYSNDIVTLTMTNGAATFSSSVTAAGYLISGDNVLKLNSIASVQSQQIYYQNNGTTKFQLFLDTATNNFGIYNNALGSSSFTLTSGGNVLIGTTTDDTVNKLQVTGSAKVSTTLTINNSGIITNTVDLPIVTTKTVTITFPGTNANAIQVNVGVHITAGSGHSRAMFLAGGANDGTSGVTAIVNTNTAASVISAPAIVGGAIVFTIQNSSGTFIGTAIIEVISAGYTSQLSTITIT
jgi:hypothetical protein